MRHRSAFLTACALVTTALVPVAPAAARPTAAQTLAAARALGVGADAAKLQKRFLPAARLLPVRGGRAKVGGSRMGGAPDLPRGTAWPTCHGGHRLSLLAQLDLRELARAVPGATRARGTLAVFASVVFDREDGVPDVMTTFGWLGPGACVQVRHWPRSASLAHRATPRGTTAFPSMPIRLRPTLTVPGWELAGGWLGHEVGDAWTTLTDRAAWGDLKHAAPERSLWQALGWAIPIQADPTVECRTAHQPKGPKRLLVQLDADDDLDFDDDTGGQLHVTIPAADLRAGRFDRLCGEYQID